MTHKQKRNLLSFFFGLIPSLTLEYDLEMAKYSFQTIELSILPLPASLTKKLQEYGFFNILDLFQQCPWGLDQEIDDLKEVALIAYQKLKEYFQETPEEGVLA